MGGLDRGRILRHSSSAPSIRNGFGENRDIRTTSRKPHDFTALLRAAQPNCKRSPCFRPNFDRIWGLLGFILYFPRWSAVRCPTLASQPFQLRKLPPRTASRSRHLNLCAGESDRQDGANRLQLARRPIARRAMRRRCFPMRCRFRWKRCGTPPRLATLPPHRITC